MKKIFLASLALSTALAFTGCSSSSTSSTSGSGTSSSKPPASTESGAKVIKIGTIAAADSPVDKALHNAAEEIDKNSKGKLKLDIYNNSQLGGEQAMLDNVKVGALDMVVIGDAAFAMAIPKYSGMSSLYLFKNLDGMDKFFQGSLGKQLEDQFQKTINVKVMDWWERGPRELTANKPIKTPDDLKGLKVRVPQIPNIIDTWSALGANPTPMSFDQVFNALSQKVIDAQENPLDMIYTSKFYEVQKYVMLTNHMTEPWIVMMSSDNFQKLSADDQKVLSDAIKNAGKQEAQLVRSADQQYIQKMKDAGVTIVDVDQKAFLDKYNSAVNSIDEKYKDKWDLTFLKQVRESQK